MAFSLVVSSTTYSPNYTRNEYENHGCIIMKADSPEGPFETITDGQMYLVIHAPNDWGGDSSRMTFVPVIERNGCLVWDLNLE